MTPPPGPATVVKPRPELAATPAPAPPTDLGAHMHIESGAVTGHDLDAHDHDLAGEP